MPIQLVRKATEDYIALMKPLAIIETCLYVDNLQLAEDFYTQVLGLQIHSHKPERHLFLRCGKGMLLLFNASVTSSTMGTLPSHGTKSNTHLAFAIAEDELELWRKHLGEAGVKIEKEQAWPSGGYSLYFRDPAGNSLEVTTPSTWNISL